jgi:outer membrane protein assembly factor BamB
MRKSLKMIITIQFLIMGSNLSMANDFILWKFATAGGIYSTPLIHENTLYIGSLDSNFYAIDVSTGTEQWHYKTENKIYSTAAIYQDLICFESGNQLYGLNLQGELQWQFPLYIESVTNQIDAWDYFHSSPRLADSIAYIGTENGLVYGVNVKTGSEVFQIQTSRQYTIRTTPVIYNDRIFLGDWYGALYAYDIPTENLIWEYDTYPEKLWGGQPAITTSPVIFNNAVHFAGRSCIVFSVDIENGMKNWSYPSPSNQWYVGGPSIVDSVLYIGSSDQRLIHAIDAVSGELKWQRYTDYRINGTPLIDGDYVYVGTGYEPSDKFGSIFVINKENGDLVNRFVTKGQVHSSPIIDNGIIYFGCFDGNIYAINREEFLANPLPNTAVTAETIDLGIVPVTATDVDTAFTIFNTGNGDDSISIYVSVNTARELKNGTIIDPLECIISGNDSQSISIHIDPSQLKNKKYTLTLIIHSIYNLYNEQRNFIKSIMLEATGASGIIQKKSTNIPEIYNLHQNYPNPFNPVTMISFQLPEKSQVIISIYNIAGEKILDLFRGYRQAGIHSITWDASAIASGTYFIRMQAENFIKIMKCILIK